MEQMRRQTYEERFLKAYDRLEKPLFKLVILGFVFVLIAQVILAVPGGRQFLSSADRLEGQRQSGVMPTTAADNGPAKMTIRLVGSAGTLPNAWVKVNGTPVGAFTSQEVTVPVKEGDVLTVDTSSIPGLYRFEIDHNEPKISYPVPGMLVETDDGKDAEIGPVRLMN